MSETLIDILIPTFDNPSYLGPCINSILAHTQSRDVLKITVINNGSKEIEGMVTKHPLVKFIHTGKNLGWEGGLKEGLKNTSAPVVCFMNDDVYIPYASSLWLAKMHSEFRNSHVAAVGPMTNVVRGYQNIFLDQTAGHYAPYTSLLIGFCMLVRRSHLEEVGGVDDTLPGGDDLDLCIRFTKAGKKLVICRDVFVYHHGFKTGERLRGGPTKPGGWNSRDMTEATNQALIKKHGFKAFLECNNGGLTSPDHFLQPSRETEIAITKEYLKDGIIYDLGCGSSKTVPHAIGIDRVPMGDPIPYLEGAKSCADVVGDIEKEIPVPDNSADTIIARHILEHVVDTVGTLKMWISKLKDDGRIILSLPDERIAMTIPLNPEHRHAFEPKSLKAIMELLGMKEIAMRDNYNGVSFTSVFMKNGTNHGRSN